MPAAYYSTVFAAPATTVWDRIRDFGDYGWAGTGYNATVRDGRPGDAVGSVRQVETDGGLIRQRLLAHSDRDRSYTYSFLGQPPYPVRDYQATLRVTPVVDRDQAFVEWWATFDADVDQAEPAVQRFRSSFAGWLDSLAAALGHNPNPPSGMQPEPEARSYCDASGETATAVAALALTGLRKAEVRSQRP